jgi:uncharacterized membrane protein YciS (DUF1049 family)
MAILFTLTAVSAAIFYLYVLVQFRREEKRLTREHQKSSTYMVPIGKVA